MRIAVLSDTRLPTAEEYPGHGLGKVVLTVAEGLKQRGHDVTLFAGPGSRFSGDTVWKADEREYAQVDFSGYDAVLDNTHAHTLQRVRPDLPIANISHDRESPPGKNPVFPSLAHRDWHGANPSTAVVIKNAVKTHGDAPKRAQSDKGYVAYLSTFYAPKGAIMALRAAQLAGFPLVMAGPTPPAPPPGADYIGPVWGRDKDDFLGNALALLFPASTEAGPLTILEAQAVGCPVIVSEYGAAKEGIIRGITGLVARDTLEMAECICRVSQLDRTMCAHFAREIRTVSHMLDEYEAVCVRLVAGENW